jgi:hypothetical protein
MTSKDWDDFMCAVVTAIFWVCGSVETVIITVLKSVTRKCLVKAEKTSCVLQVQWYLEYVIQWDYYSYLQLQTISGQYIQYQIQNPVESNSNTWQ